MSIDYIDRMNDLLDSVKGILGDRAQQYGSPIDSFRRIADAWTLTLKQTITPIQACVMMIDFKVARLRHDPSNQDSMSDIIGYVACLNELYWQHVNQGKRKDDVDVIAYTRDIGELPE